MQTRGSADTFLYLRSLVGDGLRVERPWCNRAARWDGRRHRGCTVFRAADGTPARHDWSCPRVLRISTARLRGRYKAALAALLSRRWRKRQRHDRARQGADAWTAEAHRRQPMAREPSFRRPVPATSTLDRVARSHLWRVRLLD